MEKLEQKTLMANIEKDVTQIKSQKKKIIQPLYKGFTLLEVKNLKGGTGVKYWM